ncbi:hypothetical protein [Frondihabitans sp. VKM Ac-2883]|uniref:hypothetical protein n=1 Tax=Frondihabitans sp. VKM Ac-2883 TaxID=2783823 RepID=UPI00188CA3B5|nr:hypothetical protein [Frondihabitans sp. VKM Ac-2883]MBF4577763.1 hypothetical protein [Frondihabitans sp. VKM Ac-2883]
MSDTFDDVRAAAEFQKQIAQTIFSALPAGGWSEATGYFVQAGRMTSTSVFFVLDSGREDGLSLGRTISDPWRDMRQAMADPEKGAWLASILRLSPKGSFRFTFEYDRRPNTQADDLLEPEPPGRVQLPTDDAWRDDFAVYPRKPEFTPPWLAALVGDGAGSPASREAPSHDVFQGSPSLSAALAAAPTWPEQLAGLDGRWGWPDVFASASDHTVARLKSDADYVAVLADADRRSEWAGWLDSLAQDVFGDVYAEVLLRRDVSILLRFWRSLVEVGAVPERSGVDELDPNAPIGPISSVRPELVQRLLDDVMDALTDIIDQQLFDRFGVRPEA